MKNIFPLYFTIAIFINIFPIITPALYAKELVQLVHIIDGDSIIVIHKGKKQTIRLYGIDAPEYSQIYGKEAKQALRKLLLHKTIHIKSITKDSYSRKIAIIYANNVDINEKMLEEGNAQLYTRYCKKKRCKQYKKKENVAKKNNYGLWGKEVIEKPWNYRRQKTKNKEIQ